MLRLKLEDGLPDKYTVGLELERIRGFHTNMPKKTKVRATCHFFFFGVP